MAFKVIKIVNENTVQVYPEWVMRNLNKRGKFVKIFGYKIPDNKKAEKEKAISTLATELLGKEVKLLNPRRLTASGHVVCDVMIGKKHAMDFFPGFKE